MTTDRGANKHNAAASLVSVGQNTKKSKGFTQPLHIPSRSPAPSGSDKG